MKNIVTWILIILSATYNSSFSNIVKEKGAEIYTVSSNDVSSKISVQAYGDAVIKCSKNDVLVTKFPLKDFEVIWKKKNRGSGGWEKLKADSAIVIQKCTAEERNSCVESNILSILTLVNITLEAEGKYGCYIKATSSETLVGKAEIGVGYAPEEPVLTSSADGCVFYWKPSILTCCWNPGRPNNVETSYEMSYAENLSDDKIPGKTNCTKSSTSIVCCNVGVKNLFDVIKLHLCAVNMFGNSTSLENDVIPSRHVKPNSPTILQLQQTGNGTNDIKVVWKRPKNSYIEEYVSRIRYSKQSEENWKIVGGILQTRYELEDLRSQTQYIVQVSSKPNGQRLISGVWSEWSKGESVYTILTVPSRRFRFKGSKTIVSFAKENIIQLSWLPYDNEGEDGFFNKIICGKCSDKEQVSYNVKEATNLLLHTTFNTVCCTGRYCNDIGCSEEERKRIFINNVPDSIKNVHIFSLNSTTLSLKWTPVSHEEDTICFARLCRRSRTSGGKNAAVLSQNTTCGIEDFQPFGRPKVSCSVGSMDLFRDWNPCFEYSVTMDMEILHKNLIVQSHPSNTIFYDPPLIVMSDFVVKDDYSSYDSKLIVEWSPQVECHHIMQPVLYYRPISGSECRQSLSRCKQTFHKNIPCSSTSTTISENVYGDTTYNFTMYMMCDSGNKIDESSNANTFRSHISETTGRITTNIRAPMPPRDIIHYPSGPILSWRPPAHTNGATFYEVITEKGIYGSTKHNTSRLNATVDLDCPFQNNSTQISFTVTAINQKKDVFLRSENATFGGVPCRKIVDASTLSNYTFLIGICVGFLLLIPMVVIIYYYRKKIRLKMKRMWWPDMPMPKIDPNLMSTCEESSDHDEATRKSRRELENEINSTDISSDIVVNSGNAVEYRVLNSSTVPSTSRHNFNSSSASSNDRQPDLIRNNTENFDSSGLSSMSKHYVRVGQDDDRPVTVSCDASTSQASSNGEEYLLEASLSNNIDEQAHFNTRSLVDECMVQSFLPVSRSSIDQDSESDVKYITVALNPKEIIAKYPNETNSRHVLTNDVVFGNDSSTAEYTNTKSSSNSEYNAIWESLATNDDHLCTNFEHCENKLVEENVLSDYVEDIYGTSQKDIERLSCSSGIVEDMNETETLDIGLKKFLQNLTTENEFGQSAPVVERPNTAVDNVCEGLSYVDLETASLLSS